MGLFGSIKNVFTRQLTRQINNSQRIATVNAFANTSVAIYPDSEFGDNIDSYVTIDEVYAVITRVARTAALVPVNAYKIVDEKKAKQLSKIKQPHTKLFEVKNLVLKALDDLEETDKVYALFDSPATGSTKFEFYEAVYTFLLATGNAFILKQRPELGANKGLTVKLKVLHPQNVIIKVSQELPRRIVGYDYREEGQIVWENIPVSDMIHVKYFNPTVGATGSDLIGLSPLTALTKLVTRIDANMDASVAQLQNGGVKVLISDSGLQYEASDVAVLDARKDNYGRFSNNPSNHGAAFWTNGEIKVHQLGLSAADLELIEQAKVNLKRLCNAYGVSSRIFNDDGTGSEISDDNARKGLYLDAVLPNVYRVVDALKLGILEEFEKGREYVEGENVVRITGDGKKRDLQADLSEVSVLQENFKEMATWLAAAWWITPNEKRQMMKFDTIQDEYFNQPLLPAGLMSLEDAQAVPDLPVEGEGK